MALSKNTKKIQTSELLHSSLRKLQTERRMRSVQDTTLLTCIQAARAYICAHFDILAGHPKKCKQKSTLLQYERMVRPLVWKSSNAHVKLAYLRYLWQSFSYKKVRTKDIALYYHLCRDVVTKDPGNKQGLLALALWRISPCNVSTQNWAAFIKQQEDTINTLPLVDRFDALLVYSQFYIKQYQTQKAFALLHQAGELFPSNMTYDYISTCYSNGTLGW